MASPYPRMAAEMDGSFAAFLMAVHGNMPAFGLGAAGRLVPAEGRRVTARRRLEIRGAGTCPAGS